MSSLLSFVRPPPSQFRLAACLARQFHRSSLRASKATNREPLSRRVAPAKTTRLRRSEANQTSRSVNNNLETDQLKRRWYATNLYNNGLTRIYQAPSSHRGMFAASYFMAGSCIFIALGTAYFSTQDIYNRKADLPWYFNVSVRLVIIVFTFIGGYILIQPFNMVRSIDLVKQHDTVKLLVQVRRHFPFLQPREHIIDPFNLKVKQSFAIPSGPAMFESFEEPASAQSSKSLPNPFSYIARGLSRGIYSFFLSVQKLMTSEGIMSLRLVEGETTTRCKLDATGRWSNNGKDFMSLTVIDLDR